MFFLFLYGERCRNFLTLQLSLGIANVGQSTQYDSQPNGEVILLGRVLKAHMVITHITPIDFLVVLVT